jgi:PIN domain nuclease of toxin-antitoxin system
MRLLLDTHIFLWFVTGDDKLPSRFRPLMEAKETRLFLSLVSAWEMALKANLGKLNLDRNLSAYVAYYTSINRIELLPITVEHLEATIVLPQIHRDPFDRSLVAQAQIEKLTILIDPRVDKYNIQCLK